MGGEGSDDEVDHPQEGAVPGEERDREMGNVHGEGAQGEGGELAKDVVDGGRGRPLDGVPEMRGAGQGRGRVGARELFQQSVGADEPAEQQGRRGVGELAFEHHQMLE